MTVVGKDLRRLRAGGAASCQPFTGPLHRRAVGRTRTCLRTLFTMACLALAFVFANASATSVVDRFQHETGSAHDHGLRLSLTVDDHLGDHAGDHHDNGDDRGAPNHAAGIGHHHADAPTGALDGATSIASLRPATAVPVSFAPEHIAARFKPGGPERPPRSLSLLV